MIYFRLPAFLIIFIVIADKALVALPKITPTPSYINYGFFSANSWKHLITASFPYPAICPSPALIIPYKAPVAKLMPRSLPEISYFFEKLVIKDLPPSESALLIA